MTYADFASKMLIALYQDTEVGDNDVFTFGNLIEHYGLDSRPRWITQLASEWDRFGYATVRKHIGDPLTWRGDIAAEGLRLVESQFGSKDGVGSVLEPASQRALVGSPDAEKTETSPRVDSRDWTGLSAEYELTEPKRAELIDLLVRAEDELSRASIENSTKAQVYSYIVAARALAEAPEPQADLIWEIVSRANQVAGIASLFVSILTLFVS